MPADEQVEPGLVAAHQGGERRLAAGQDFGDQLGVGRVGSAHGERISAMITCSSKSGRWAGVSTWRIWST